MGLVTRLFASIMVRNESFVGMIKIRLKHTEIRRSDAKESFQKIITQVPMIPRYYEEYLLCKLQLGNVKLENINLPPCNVNSGCKKVSS